MYQFSQSGVLWLILVWCIVSTADSIDQHTGECISPQDIPRQTALTDDRLKELCGNSYKNDPTIVVQHATHCAGVEKQTNALRLSIANGLFGLDGGNSRNCEAHCVRNSEGRGYFKYNPGSQCFNLIGGRMCGSKSEDKYSKLLKHRLCRGNPTFPPQTPNLFRFYKMSGKPENFSYPLVRYVASTFQPTTDAVSLRVFEDEQIQVAISDMEGKEGKKVTNFDQLSAILYDTHPNLKPTHPDSSSSTDREHFWNEFREVIAVQQKRIAGDDASSIFQPASCITEAFGPNISISTAAASVFDDFPTDFPTLLMHRLNSMNSGTLDQKLNTVIFNQCTYYGPEFVNGFVAVGDMIGWAIRAVSPAAFASKWHIGRARPEEVAWEIHQNSNVSGGPSIGDFLVPEDVVESIRSMNLQNRADFTAYKTSTEGSTTFGSGGSPVHPAYPAMHSAASTSSTWLSVVFDLSDAEINEARLLDFSVSYFRTMAGVHYRSDNRAGLALGQHIVKSKLPDYLADKYGCNDETKHNIRKEVNRKIKLFVDTHDWATWLPDNFKDPTE